MRKDEGLNIWFSNVSISSVQKFKLVILMSLIIPSSGYVLLGKSKRGIMMFLWMFFFGYITYRLAPEGASSIGRIAGALAIWTLSVVEIHSIAKKKWIINNS